MEEFIASLPEDVKKMGKEVEEFWSKFEPKPQVWKNIRGIVNLNMEVAIYAYDHWTPRKGDVFITTYPKCGTHWMCEVVKQILFIRNPKHMEIMNARGKGVLSAQLIFECGTAAKFVVADKFPCARIFYTHLPSELINFDKIKANGGKVIYIYRNPKDLIVSYFHFQQNLTHAPGLTHLRTNDFNTYIKQLVGGEQWTSVPEGEWYPYHIKSWITHRSEKCVKFIAYEDMKKDFKSVARDLVEFLEVERTEDEIIEIEKLCLFRKMQADAEGSSLGEIKLFRKGEVGDWKNYFTVAQSEELDKHLKIAMKDVDIEFQYEI